MKSKLIDMIAQERINILARLAENEETRNTQESITRAKRYALIAKKISSHYKVKMSRDVSNKICKRCSNFLVPGINCTVRKASSPSCIIYTCDCGKQKKILLESAK
jgi:ribonuclease P protein subunit RPR2